jgi:hypothetical protein
MLIPLHHGEDGVLEGVVEILEHEAGDVSEDVY